MSEWISYVSLFLQDPLYWLSTKELGLRTLSRVTESPIATDEEPLIRKNVELFNSLQVNNKKLEPRADQ